MNQELLALISSSPQLPTLPVIAMKVLELTRREDVSVPEIGNLIMTDAALASKILKTVNSPFYGLTKQVSTVSGALVILGLQAAKTLALGFSLLNNLKKAEKGDATFDCAGYWKRSLYCAVSSRVIAQKLSVVQQEEAFLAGLLAPMGILVLHRVVPEKFDALYAEARGDYTKLSMLCNEKMGLTPTEVSAFLADKWQLPPLLARPISLQETRDETDAQMRPLIEAVSAGVLAGAVFGADDSAQAINNSRRELAGRFSFSPEEIETLLADIGASARDAAKLFDMQIGRERSYQEILDEAQEALVCLSLQNQKQMQSIQREVETLTVKATTDPLTGLANRARFDEFYEEQFLRAYTHQRPLALIFIDLDHFKKVNDTYGHQAGDEVLRRVAKLLRASVRNIDLVARYGGEEFAAVLTETDTAAAAVRAEAIRTKLSAEVIRFEGKQITMTLSAGVAGTDRTRIFAQPAQLTNAADRAVYAAKAASRNCVRVFKPAVESTVKTVASATAAKAVRTPA